VNTKREYRVHLGGGDEASPSRLGGLGELIWKEGGGWGLKKITKARREAWRNEIWKVGEYDPHPWGKLREGVNGKTFRNRF